KLVRHPQATSVAGRIARAHAVGERMVVAPLVAHLAHDGFPIGPHAKSALASAVDDAVRRHLVDCGREPRGVAGAEARGRGKPQDLAADLEQAVAVDRDPARTRGWFGERPVEGLAGPVEPTKVSAGGRPARLTEKL